MSHVNCFTIHTKIKTKCKKCKHANKCTKNAITPLNWPLRAQVISYSRKSVHQPVKHMMKQQFQKQIPLQKMRTNLFIFLICIYVGAKLTHNILKLQASICKPDEPVLKTTNLRRETKCRQHWSGSPWVCWNWANVSRMKKFYNHEFYTAIMDEDLGQIEDLTKKHGSNFPIPVQDTAYGDLWKVKKMFRCLMSHSQKKCQPFS